MTTTKQSWLKRSLAMLLAVMMVMSMGVTNAFAADSGSEESNVPVIDVYKRQILPLTMLGLPTTPEKRF